MTETVNTSPNDQAVPQDEAAILTQARADQDAVDRVEREADIQTPGKARAKKSGLDLSSLFSAAGSYLLLHDIPGHGKIGKGPNCVIDHGTHIYIPPNATPDQLQTVAQLAQKKGWNSVAVFKAGGSGLHERYTATLQQMAPHLNLCTDRRQTGSLYSCRRELILNHIAAKQMHRAAMQEQATSPAPQDAEPQPA